MVSQNRIGNHAKNLLHAISQYRDQDGTSNRPLFLVSHSLGGLVCEDTVLSSRNSADTYLQCVIQSTRGIIFMGTPHSGAAIAKWAELFAKSIGLFKQTTSKMLEVLTIESEVLERIQTDFHTLIRELNHAGNPIQLTCFYEEKGLPGVGTIVPKHSAILPGHPHIGINANHETMSRFSNDQDPGFIAVAGELQRWMRALSPHAKTKHGNTNLFMVPYDRHPDFVGRQDVMNDLKKSLERERLVALAGIGGIGKSEIAIEYCYRFQDQHPNGSLFWVPADSLDKFEQAYTIIARKLNIPRVNDSKFNVLREVKEYLTEAEIEPWLMVLDNADDLDMLITNPVGSNQSAPLAAFLPRSASGKIVLTTRDAYVGLAMTNRDPIFVYPLYPQDAAELLRKSIPENDNPEEKVVQQILFILENLPLAITQAAAYIKRNKISTAQYLEELTESDAGLQALLSDDQFDSRRGLDSINSVIRTWKLSFDRIQRKYSRAARLLCVMALLNRQNIPRMLLRTDGESQSELTSALGVLQSFSLIKAEKGGNTYTMHRLIQFVTCVWQRLQGTQLDHQLEALNLVMGKFPSAGNYERQIHQSLFPHAVAVQNHEFKSESSQIIIAALRHKIAWYEVQQGHYDNAKSFCTRAFEARGILVGAGKLETLQSAGLLGEILKFQGSYEEATLILKGILAQKEIMLGLDHLDTVQSLSDLTDLLTRQGDYSAAETAARKVLKARMKMLGQDHLKVLSIQTTLANILNLRGKCVDAERTLRKTLDQYHRILGTEHEKTLICSSVLYLTLQELGKYEEAITLCRQIVTIRRRILGSEHPHTLTAINNLAMLERLMSKFSSAEQLYREIIPILDKTLGSENPETMASSSNLAVALRDQGKYEEAELLFQQTLERRERVLGRKNPRTLITLDEYALLLSLQERFDEAEKAALSALETRIEVFGEQNPEALTSLCTLASIMRRKGDLECARKMYEKALRGRLQVLGETHPETVACRSNLAVVIKELAFMNHATVH